MLLSKRKELGKIEKLIERFKGRPKDFTWSELERLLTHYEFVQFEGDGSRVKFKRDDGITIALHRPHPKQILKSYQVKKVFIILSVYDLL